MDVLGLKNTSGQTLRTTLYLSQKNGEVKFEPIVSYENWMEMYEIVVCKSKSCLTWVVYFACNFINMCSGSGQPVDEAREHSRERPLTPEHDVGDPGDSGN